MESSRSGGCGLCEEPRGGEAEQAGRIVLAAHWAD